MVKPITVTNPTSDATETMRPENSTAITAPTSASGTVASTIVARQHDSVAIDRRTKIRTSSPSDRNPNVRFADSLAS